MNLKEQKLEEEIRVLRGEVFNLLKSRGPQCVSQISVELGISTPKIETVLVAMEEDGLVFPRPDTSHELRNSSSRLDLAWGLRRF